MAKLRPPRIEKGILHIEREPATDWITMTFPNGDSYSLDVVEMKIWMRMMRIDEDDSRSPLDRVWNFYNIVYNVETMEFQAILAEERMRAAG